MENQPFTFAELHDRLQRLTNEIDGIARALEEMTPIRLVCPHCGKQNVVDQALVGKPGWCTH